MYEWNREDVAAVLELQFKTHQYQKHFTVGCKNVGTPGLNVCCTESVCDQKQTWDISVEDTGWGRNPDRGYGNTEGKGNWEQTNKTRTQKVQTVEINRDYDWQRTLTQRYNVGLTGVETQ